MAIDRGMDIAIGVAMAVNIVSNIINMIYLKKEKEYEIRTPAQEAEF